MSEPRSPIRDVRSGLAKLVGDAPIPCRVFPFAGAGGRFGDETRWCVRAMSAGERLAAVGAAVKFLVEVCGLEREDLFTAIGSAAFELESKTQALAICLVDPDDARKTFAKDAAELRKTLEADEIERLFNELAAYTEERSPLSRAADGEDFRAEVEALLVALGKGIASKTRLHAFDYASLLSITTLLARRLYGPTRPSSSDTSPPSASSATAPTG